MSATTRRLAEIEKAAPLNITPDQLARAVYNPEVFSSVYALIQAWPLLRAEIERLEDHGVALLAENLRLTTERTTMVSTAGATAMQHAQEVHYLREQVATLDAQLTACRDQLAAAAAEVAKMPERTQVAERVMASMDPHHGGKGSTWLYVDGAALDAWKALR